MLVNPFHELYLGDTVDEVGFVDLFSPVLLNQVSGLYRPGNVALVGSQGNGKSMLLGLLKPETRLAYARSEKPFPLDPPYSTFIGCGINIIQSPAKDFGQRVPEGEPIHRLALYYGDYLNYWIVQDLLTSVQLLANSQYGSIKDELGMKAAEANLDSFAMKMGSNPCWIGWMAGVQSFIQLRERLKERLETYRDYLNFNIEDLPDDVSRTTTSVGTCVSECANTLRDCEVVGPATSIFVKLDQLDSLLDLGDELGPYGQTLRAFRQIINKLLGQRDPIVSYKVGVRPFAWKQEMRIYGTGVDLEANRDYLEVDIDSILQRTENKKLWIFPIFAEDMFKRRLAYAGFRPTPPKTLQYVLGDGMDDRDRARKYVRRDLEKVVKPDPSWTDTVVDELRTLAKVEPLQAKFIEAWGRQKGLQALLSVASGRDGLKGFVLKPYWRKERVQQALLQIAAGNHQRLLWSGRDDVIQLSGYNVLSLLRVYRGIWDAWLQEQPHRVAVEPTRTPQGLSPITQSSGIETASDEWHSKLTSEAGPDRFMRFADFLGTMFRQTLREDVAMSNPGFNGFSVALEELDSDLPAKQLINDACAFGVLTSHKHTSKNRDQKLRRKYYLNALLSPFYQIPANHPKEPKYVPITEVRGWLAAAGLVEASAIKVSSDARSKSSQKSDNESGLGGLFEGVGE